MSFYKKLLTLIILISSFVYGQGTLRGVISDSLINKPLVGANVFLLGTALGSATDLEGQYVIPTIPAGNYTLKISYIGYKPKQISLTIANNRSTQLDVTLVPDVVEGEEVVVTGQASGQMQLTSKDLPTQLLM